MICRRGGIVIQLRNELRDVKAEMLNMLCNGVEIEPVMQEITGESLNMAMMLVWTFMGSGEVEIFSLWNSDAHPNKD